MTIRALTAPRAATHETGLRTIGAATACFVVALLYNVFAGHSRELGLPIGLDRVLFPVAFAFVLLDSRRPALRLRAAHAFMAVFVLLAAGSAAWHGTLTTADSAYALIDRLVLPFALFTTAPLFLDSPARQAAFLRGLTLLGGYLAAVTIAQTIGAHALIRPSYVGSAGAAAADAAEPFRAGGPFLSGEANGMALAMCAAAAFLLVAQDRGWWRRLGWAVGLVAAAASILSMTRSVWLSVALATVAAVAVERRLWRFLPRLLALAAGLVLIGAMLLPDVVADMTTRGGTSRSLFDRANTNAAAMRVIADDPLFGIGWGRFVTDGWDWVRQADGYPLTSVNIEVHNVLLSRAAELGIPAALLYLACLVFGPGAALVRAHRLAADPWYPAALAIAVIWIVPAMTSPNPYTFPAFVAFTVTGLLDRRERASARATL